MSKVRVLRTGITFGGWKATVEIDGGVLRVVEDGGERRLDIDAVQVKRYSFNGNNGMWAFRMRDGRKLYVQSAGTILSADRSPAGRETNQRIHDLMRRHHSSGFRI